MDEKGLRELLMQRLYMEFMLFKDSMLQKEKEEIFRSCYEIEIYLCLYEIFAEYVDGMEGGAIRRMLKLNFDILGFLYRGWLEKGDGLFEGLKDYTCSVLEIISGKGKRDGKDGRDGKKHNKAAKRG